MYNTLMNVDMNKMYRNGFFVLLAVMVSVVIYQRVSSPVLGPGGTHHTVPDTPLPGPIPVTPPTGSHDSPMVGIDPNLIIKNTNEESYVLENPTLEGEYLEHTIPQIQSSLKNSSYDIRGDFPVTQGETHDLPRSNVDFIPRRGVC